MRHREGLVHGFLVLRTLNGETLADGDLIQNESGDRVITHLVFHFKDGSLYDETTVFSQRRYFQLIKDHLVQKGPAFKKPIELTTDDTTGRATARYMEDGKAKTATENVHGHADLANGLVLILLKNIHPSSMPLKVGMVVPTPKPKLVKLAITAQGEENFETGKVERRAMHSVIKIEITGLSGIAASLLGKQPPDTNVWILGGKAPAFVRYEGAFEAGGPIWRIELAAPLWSDMNARH